MAQLRPDPQIDYTANIQHLHVQLRSDSINYNAIKSLCSIFSAFLVCTGFTISVQTTATSYAIDDLFK